MAFLVSGAMAQPGGDGPATRPARPDESRQQGQQRPERPPRPMMDPQQILDRVRNAVGELDLSAEQKTKVDERLQQAAKDLKDIHDDLEIQGTPEGRRGGPYREYMRQLHEDLNQILTDEQAKNLREKLGPPRDGRQGPDGRPGREDRQGPEGRQQGPATRPFGQGVRDALGKLDLSEEQKTQIDQLLKESAEKMRALQQEAREQGERRREEFRELMRDTHEKLNELLTPEQREKLRELIPRRGPGGREGQVGPDDRRGPEGRRGPGGGPPDGPDGDRGPRGPRNDDGARPDAPPPPPPQDQPRGEQI